eukprot:6196331-Pyramimonas_sp.AAC.1
MNTPSGHLALKADEYGAAAEDKRSMSFTIAAHPQCEDALLLVKEAADTEPAAGTGHQLLHQRGDVRFTI